MPCDVQAPNTHRNSMYFSLLFLRALGELGFRGAGPPHEGLRHDVSPPTYQPLAVSLCCRKPAFRYVWPNYNELQMQTNSLLLGFVKRNRCILGSCTSHFTWEHSAEGQPVGSSLAGTDTTPPPGFVRTRTLAGCGGYHAVLGRAARTCLFVCF